MNRRTIIVAASVVLGGVFFASPAFAQEVEAPPAEEVPVELVDDVEEAPPVDPAAGLVNGVFGLTLEGQVPANVSFYAEANIGSGGEVICTTDDALVGAGYPECVGGGAVNEVSFVAPAGQDIQYRILGSLGTGLSQEVLSEGTAVAAEGVRIDAGYAFPAEPLEDLTEDPIQQPEWEPDADEGQYGEVSSNTTEGADGEDAAGAAGGSGEGTPEQSGGAGEAVIPAERAAASVVPGSVADIATGGTGLLPNTGGLAPWPVLGALLLAGGLLARRLVP